MVTVTYLGNDQWKIEWMGFHMVVTGMGMMMIKVQDAAERVKELKEEE